MERAARSSGGSGGVRVLLMALLLLLLTTHLCNCRPEYVDSVYDHTTDGSNSNRNSNSNSNSDSDGNDRRRLQEKDINRLNSIRSWNAQLVQETKSRRRDARKKDREKGGAGGGPSVGTGTYRAALEEFVSNMVPEVDYNASHWRYKWRSVSPSNYFEGYNKMISEVLAKHGLPLNFLLIGACDGTSDITIKHRFLKYEHWRAAFVEPMSNNVADLRNMLVSLGVANRSHVIHAACTAKCSSPTIFVERPLYEGRLDKKNQTLPHWLRRQIGSILPENRKTARKDWMVEEVKCVTPDDICEDWTKNVLESDPAANIGRKKNKKMRIHVLKIDVEGHDFDVLMGFMKKDAIPAELPIMINFEAKSIAKKYPAAKERMEALGYVVSQFAQDGFAILKPSSMFGRKSLGDAALVS